jgi:hypothetical protein
VQGDEQQHSSLRARVVGLMQSREEDFAPFVEDDQSFAAYTARMKKVRCHKKLAAAAAATATALLSHCYVPGRAA